MYIYNLFVKYKFDLVPYSDVYYARYKAEFKPRYGCAKRIITFSVTHNPVTSRNVRRRQKLHKYVTLGYF